VKAIKLRVFHQYHLLEYNCNTDKHFQKILSSSLFRRLLVKMTAFPLIFVKRGAEIATDRTSEKYQVKACSSLSLHKVQSFHWQYHQKDLSIVIVSAGGTRRNRHFRAQSSALAGSGDIRRLEQ